MKSVCGGEEDKEKRYGQREIKLLKKPKYA